MKVETSDALRLADTMRTMPAAIQRAEYRAVNKVAAKANTSSQRRIVSNVNLSATYVRARMFLEQAKLGSPTATITGRSRPTTLFSYSARVRTVAAPTAKGSAATGIPAGRKFQGVSVSVKRGGAAKALDAPNYFLVKLRGSNGLGIFSRVGGKLKHHYGPSVDQGFRLVIDDTAPAIVADLDATFRAQLDFEMTR